MTIKAIKHPIKKPNIAPKIQINDLAGSDFFPLQPEDRYNRKQMPHWLQ